MSGSPVTIFHYPRCTKSRKALALLQELFPDVIIRQLKTDPPAADEIRLLAQKLKMQLPDMVSPSATGYKKSLCGKHFSEHEWLHILAENPLLIRRPMVVRGCRAVIADPPERIRDLFDLNHFSNSD